MKSTKRTIIDNCAFWGICFSLVDGDGVPPAFRKKNTLRAYEILYSFSANPITNKNLKIVLG
ncbi:hypothetical protein CN957_31120 [Bacillus cereus]|nr:hypothetical protein CN467_10925 [Bacillus cereus]PFD34853.1 hypothetical protein CN285_24800 [Bacillus cereus]PGM71277.1 hypothetical protein CN957_31120 [Bacillus cereus]